jgi:hypothetical protein
VLDFGGTCQVRLIVVSNVTLSKEDIFASRALKHIRLNSDSLDFSECFSGTRQVRPYLGLIKRHLVSVGHVKYDCISVVSNAT